MSALPRPRQAGFTLIEILAVVFLTSIVLTVAVGFYVNLSRASQAANDHVRAGRHAVAVLDRVARDLEAARLVVKPGEVDPIEFPWLFYAERRGAGPGADALKFTMRGNRPAGSVAHESDLAVVAYVTRETPDGLELWRWSSPRLPERRDRDLPRPEDDGTVLLAEGLAGFGVRWLDEDGQWSEAWDSSLLDRSSQLPVAAEITVAVPAERPATARDDLLPGEAPQEIHRRQVLLPVRPIDLVALLQGPGEEEAGGEEDQAGEGDEDCVTVAQCIAANRALADARYGPDLVESFLQQMGSMCASDSPFQVPADFAGCE